MKFKIWIYFVRNMYTFFVRAAFNFNICDGKCLHFKIWGPFEILQSLLKMFMNLFLCRGSPMWVRGRMDLTCYHVKCLHSGGKGLTLSTLPVVDWGSNYWQSCADNVNWGRVGGKSCAAVYSPWSSLPFWDVSSYLCWLGQLTRRIGTPVDLYF